MLYSERITLDTIASHVPDASGLFQVRVREGLLSYPKGKSAMFYYGYADNLNRGLTKFCKEILPLQEINQELLFVRWMTAEDTTTRFQNYLNSFVTNFGTLPLGNEMLLHKRGQPDTPTP